MLIIFENICLNHRCLLGNPHDVVANVLNYDIVVSEFEIHSYFYIHFQTNTFDKGMNLFIPFTTMC